MTLQEHIRKGLGRSGENIEQQKRCKNWQAMKRDVKREREREREKERNEK